MTASPESLREALEQAHSILEWIGTEIDLYKSGDRRRRPDYEAWVKATLEGCDNIEAALQRADAAPVSGECGYECPYTREAHEQGMADHPFEERASPAPEGLRAALQAKSEAYHSAFIREAGPHRGMVWSNCTSATCEYDRRLLAAAPSEPEPPVVGEHEHDFRLSCVLCGARGTVVMSIAEVPGPEPGMKE